MNKQNTALIFFLFSLIFCLLAVNAFIYNNPRFSKKAMADHYQKLSEQVSPNSVQAKRFRAIANAISGGHGTYYFTTNKIPAINNQ